MPIEVKINELRDDRARVEHQADFFARMSLIKNRRGRIASERGKFSESEVQKKLQQQHEALIATKKAADAEREPDDKQKIEEARRDLETASSRPEIKIKPPLRPPFAVPEKKEGFFKKAWEFIKRGW